MEITIKTKTKQQEKYLIALIKSLEELGIQVAIEKSSKIKNGKEAMAILGKISALGGIPSIPDPIKWQRKIRKDRKLPL
jgi:hypothetical protein